jgi:non-specific serine/threonine protein kinase
VAEDLGVQERPDILLTDVIVDTFRERRTLLVPDNCEHLVDAAARLLEALLAACPKVRSGARAL